MSGNPTSIGLGGLNPHEVATMELVMEGMPNMRIAERLGVSEGDSMRAIISIYKKRNVRTRLEAASTSQRLKAEASYTAK